MKNYKNMMYNIQLIKKKFKKYIIHIILYSLFMKLNNLIKKIEDYNMHFMNLIEKLII